MNLNNNGESSGAEGLGLGFLVRADGVAGNQLSSASNGLLIFEAGEEATDEIFSQSKFGNSERTEIPGLGGGETTGVGAGHLDFPRSGGSRGNGPDTIGTGALGSTSEDLDLFGGNELGIGIGRDENGKDVGGGTLELEEGILGGLESVQVGGKHRVDLERTYTGRNGVINRKSRWWVESNHDGGVEGETSGECIPSN